MGAVKGRRSAAAAVAAAVPVLAGFGVRDAASVRAIVRRAGGRDLEAALADWFRRLLDFPPGRAATALAAGRLLWLDIDAGRRWPEALLAEGALPEALARLVKERRPAPPPIEVRTAMPAASLDPIRLGVPGIKPQRRPRSA
jgi:hypothetical protein